MQVGLAEAGLVVLPVVEFVASVLAAQFVASVLAAQFVVLFAVVVASARLKLVVVVHIALLPAAV